MLNLQQARRKALVLSPAASHPMNYGNRRRVYQTTQFFQTHNFDVHFLLYPMESDWMKRSQKSERAMRDAWSNFTVLPSTRPIPLQTPPAGELHEIDEWWDPSIEIYLNWLFARETFDVFVVNYAFLSKAFEFTPKETVKILETHDRFSGRKELLAALGARLESFYTNETQESIALDRSDIVVAIKDSEAEFYQRLTKRTVISIPYWMGRDEPSARPIPVLPQPELHVGFLGALNTVNVSNMWSFIRAFEKRQQAHRDAIKISIAGEVCYHLHEMKVDSVFLLGRVESLEQFYGSVDVIVAPMEHSTGLKIKVGEALSYGKAIVATQNGFDGFPPTDEFHTLNSMDAVCGALSQLAGDSERLALLTERTETAARLAQEQVEAGYNNLLDQIAIRPRTVVFITDRQIDDIKNVDVERSAQWCHLCAQTGNTVLISLGTSIDPEKRTELFAVDVLNIPKTLNAAREVVSALANLEGTRDIVEIVLSVRGKVGQQLWEDLHQRYEHITLDTWNPELACFLPSEREHTFTDFWQAPKQGTANDEGVRYHTVALRYGPAGLDIWKGNSAPKGAIMIACGPTSQDIAGMKLLATTSTSLFPVSTVNLSSFAGEEMDASFYDSLAALERPEVVVAVGTDPRAISICESVARSVGVPIIRIALSGFPYGVSLDDGTIDLCKSYAEFARHLRHDTPLAIGATLNRQGEGWENYSRGVMQRPRKTTKRLEPVALKNLI